MTTIKYKRTEKIITIIMLLAIMLPTTLALTINNIPDKSIEENSTLTITLQATNNTGTVNWTKNQGKGTINTINITSAEFEWTPTFSEAGTYNFEFTATDTNQTKTKTTTITVNNKNNPITVLSHQSIGTIEETTAKINITTDKAATCKYDTNPETYENMRYTLSKDPSDKKHEGTTPTLNQGEHTTYIQCEDEQKNHLENTYEIDFTINLAPSAKISLDPTPPLRAEKVRVTLTASEELIDAPELKYYYDNGGGERTITLVGEGTTWKGYLIIEPTETARVGTFNYKGTDKTNKIGTEITNGKIFLLDTRYPNQVRSLELENRENNIKLKWTYEGYDENDIKEYKIYKKTGSGGVTYNHEYDETDNTYYYDEDIKIGEAYYYKISAVDSAGNEGELSKEAFITYVPPETKEANTKPDEQPTGTELNDKLKYKLQILLDQTDKTITDITESETQMERTTGTDNIDAIQELALLSKIKAAKAKAQKYRQELKNLENKPLTETEFNKQTDEILGKIREAWLQTPNKIEITDKNEYQEFVNDEKTDKAMNMMLQEINLTEKEKNTLIEQTIKLQDKIIINAKIINAKITYPQKEERRIIIYKTIQSEQTINDVVLLELIPENLKLNETPTFNRAPETIKQKELYKWNIGSLSEEKITYVLETEESIIEAKNVKTLLAKKEATQPIPGITGMASAETGSLTGNALMPIIAGLLVVGLLGTYYFVQVRQTDSKDSIVDKMLTKARYKFTKNKRIIPERKIQNTHSQTESNKQNAANKTLNAEQSKSSEQNAANKTQNEERQTQNADHRLLNIEHFEDTVTDFDKKNMGFNVNKTRQDNLEHIYEKLKSMKPNIEDASMESLKEFNSQTKKMKALLDEIEQRNIEAYAQKAKETLKDALQYISQAAGSERNAANRTQPAEHSQSSSQTTDHRTQNTEKPTADRRTKTDQPQTADHSESSSQNTGRRVSQLKLRAPKGKEFITADGIKLRTLGELREYIRFMKQEVFRHHVNEHKNDFATWIKEALEKEEIAKRIILKKSKEEIKKVLDRL